MADVRDAMTERLLADAGVGAGMHVLDVGCGGGDVTCMAARLVGDGGRVLGVDRDPRPIAAARERALQLGLTQVRFEAADLGEVPDAWGPFDVVVGRRVLMYQPNAVESVRRLARLLRPGGVIIFQEHDATMTPASRVPLPLHAQVHAWTWQTVAREGANVHMGFDLPTVFEQAGLAVEHARAEAVVLTPGAAYPFGAIVRAMRPRMVHHGVATEAELDDATLDRLDQRLLAERAAAGATYIGDMVFGVWARKPVA